ncbi:MAG TPA: peptidoglycan DD-metalloendopeptidase family protein [Paludibacter sp.]|nr:peptidoglycan DD-metalloendopeptidase family protein [Paludibacter sp.]
MRHTFIYKIIITVIFLNCIAFSPAQTVKELENQRKQALQQLETMNKMLNETSKSKRSSINKITLLNKNIAERKKLINNISTEIQKLDNEVQKLASEKKVLETKLSMLKNDYAHLVQEAHINKSIYTKIMFVLSADSFDKSYRRLRYLGEYSDYRKQQVNKIQKVTTDISNKTVDLNKNKNTKVEVVKQKESEAQKLTKDQQKEKEVMTDLQKKEKKLRADLKIQQKKANDINNKIQNIIAAEIRKAEAKRAEEERKRIAAENKKKNAETTSSTTTKETTSTTKEPKTVSKPSVSILTKEETLISGNFSANAGRLPWPTEKGFISGHYGVHAHPVLKHVTTNNKGVYIQTPGGTNARAVFEGEVTQRFSIPGSNNAVIIKHGEYRTVYANLTSIYVNVGQKVSAKQSIGKIYTDDENDNKTELYFQIWKGKNLLNPESWITR